MTIQNLCSGLQHIGIPVSDLEVSREFYASLGFRVEYDTRMEHEGSNLNVAFMRLGELVLELYQYPPEPPAGRNGAVDHIAIDCSDIDELFRIIRGMDIRMADDEIHYLPFYEHGVRFFTILGPDGEKIEFNQKGRG